MEPSLGVSPLFLCLATKQKSPSLHSSFQLGSLKNKAKAHALAAEKREREQPGRGVYSYYSTSFVMFLDGVDEIIVLYHRVAS